MQIVINITDYIKEQVDDGKGEELEIPLWLAYEIKNCILLPKGHGRLIDADDLMEIYSQFEFCSDMGDAMEILDHKPTIIEADTESEEV